MRGPLKYFKIVLFYGLYLNCMLYYYDMHDSKINQMYKLDCLETNVINILTMNQELNNKNDTKR